MTVLFHQLSKSTSSHFFVSSRVDPGNCHSRRAHLLVQEKQGKNIQHLVCCKEALQL